MSKRKPIDKTEARQRRNRLLESAASAQLSLTEGVREMRAIAGMTQDEFAAHRGVSARVIKAIELGQGNPTVATLNRIGEFFGLEVAFVPVHRKPLANASAVSADAQRSEANGKTDLVATLDYPTLQGINEEIKKHLDDILGALAREARSRLQQYSIQEDDSVGARKAPAPARKKKKLHPD